jgi:uncharacterized membrane protein
MKLKWMTRTALIASMYVVLTLTPPLNAFSFYAIQFRVSEALLILVWFRKEYAIGILIGTFFANVFGPLGAGFAWIDAFLGTLVTLLAMQMMIHIKPHFMSLIAPVILNGVYLSCFLPLALGLPYTFELILTTMLSVSVGEAVVVYGLGLPLKWLIQRQPSLLKVIKVV